MRVLLTTMPGVGHLHPLLPVARGLRSRGHELLVATSQGLGAEVATVGLDLAPVGAAWTTSELPVRFPDLGAIAPGPANVRVESWIPQAALLPHCAAVVTHGGYGTVAAALAHGRPLVLLPISADQPANAHRCAAAGVGIAIGPDDRSPKSIRRAVRTVLDQPGYRAAAARAAAEASAQPDLDHALDHLEALAAMAQAR